MREEFGKYYLTTKLMESEVKTTYLASPMDTPLQSVVLKVFYTVADKQDFLRQTALVKKLEHPHIAPMIDAGIEQDTPFVVSPYISDGSLNEYLASIAPERLESQRTLKVLAQVAQALEYAYSHGITHGHITTDNILLNARGQALLADFNCIEPIPDSDEQKPEQEHIIVARQDDLYALSCVAYELASGISTPAYYHVDNPAPPVHSDADLPLDVKTSVIKSIMKELAKEDGNVARFITPLHAAFFVVPPAFPFPLSTNNRPSDPFGDRIKPKKSSPVPLPPTLTQSSVTPETAISLYEPEEQNSIQTPSPSASDAHLFIDDSSSSLLHENPFLDEDTPEEPVVSTNKELDTNIGESPTPDEVAPEKTISPQEQLTQDEDSDASDLANTPKKQSTDQDQHPASTKDLSLVPYENRQGQNEDAQKYISRAHLDDENYMPPFPDSFEQEEAALENEFSELLSHGREDSATDEEDLITDFSASLSSSVAFHFPFAKKMPLPKASTAVAEPPATVPAPSPPPVPKEISPSLPPLSAQPAPPSTPIKPDVSTYAGQPTIHQPPITNPGTLYSATSAVSALSLLRQKRKQNRTPRIFPLLLLVMALFIIIPLAIWALWPSSSSTPKSERITTSKIAQTPTQTQTEIATVSQPTATPRPSPTPNPTRPPKATPTPKSKIPTTPRPIPTSAPQVVLPPVGPPTSLPPPPKPRPTSPPKPTPTKPASYYVAGSNTILSGGAILFDCKACQGGQKAYRVGYSTKGPNKSVQNGIVTFNTVNKNIAGTYTLTLSYINGDSHNRSLCMRVNNGGRTCFSTRSTGSSWYIPGSMTISVALKAGNNSISFDNPSAFAPDLVLITV